MNEATAWTKFKEDGDRKAGEWLVERYIPLAKHTAAKLHGCDGVFGPFDRDDLHACACLGLWKAINRHDPSRSSFSTYAVPVIRGTVIDSIRDLLGRYHRIEYTDIGDQEFSVEVDFDRQTEDEPSEYSIAINKIDALELINQEVHNLSKKKKQVFTEEFVKGKTKKEISKETEMDYRYVCRLSREALASVKEGVLGKCRI
jgi:RNA polymerase sigma factor (sigma-70 family)